MSGAARSAVRAVAAALVAVAVSGCNGDRDLVQGSTTVRVICRPPYSCVVMEGSYTGGLWCERADCAQPTPVTEGSR